jgi:methionyl-tRNA formyltransferase
VRILFFGSPAFAVPTLMALLASRHEVVGVVTQPDRPRGRGRHVTPGAVAAAAHDAGLLLLQPTTLADPGFRDALPRLGAELGVVAAYGRILPEWLLSLPTDGMINVHASLLPAWRGAAPVHRAVMAGERETGVTIMRVVKALDAGPMLARVVVPIGPDVTSEALEGTLAAAGATLLVDVVDRLAAGPVPETAQDDRAATYAPKITRADSPIAWTASARAIHNQVRGLHPWPRASASIGGTRVIVHRTAVPDLATTAAAGSVVGVSSAGLDVAGGDGRVVRLLDVQAEGGRVVSAAQFVAGHPITPGQRFEA